jgi:DNA-directed RNA polymerase subunit N (RpoN/RPB10)
MSAPPAYVDASAEPQLLNFPVCLTCGLTALDKHARYERLVRRGYSSSNALDAVGAECIGCRRMVLGHKRATQ